VSGTDPGPADEADYQAGERLGLPGEGPGSCASWGQRALALAIDWASGLLVLSVVVGREAWSGGGVSGTFAPLGVFFVEASVLTILLGSSFGQFVVRIGVIRVDGSRVDPVHVLIRTFLICLAIPPLIFDQDRRGLHDLAAGTVVVRRR
jgi:uncharacterized RDD family membrane protein YckC